MIGLLCFVLTVLALPFKSKLRLEAENAVLRHQLNVLRRRLPGRVLAWVDRDDGAVLCAKDNIRASTVQAKSALRGALPNLSRQLLNSPRTRRSARAPS